MNNTLIINLGNSDLNIVDLNELKKVFNNDFDMLEILNSNIKDNYRVICEKLLENIESCIDYIEFPIIYATLNKILGDLKTDELERIIVVYTDQGKPSDTIYLANILKRIYELKKCGKLKESDNPIINMLPVKKNGIFLKAINKNPSDYDLMNKYYQEVIKQLNKEGIQDLFINVTGGTQAMNTSLLFNAANEFNGNVSTYYTPRGKKKASRLNVSSTIRGRNVKGEIKKLVSFNDYKAAEVLIKNYINEFDKEVNRSVGDILLSYISAASARIQFDFKKSIDEIEHCKDVDAENRDLYYRFQESLDELIGGREKDIYLLDEVKNNAIYQYRNGAYTDFLGRIFRLQEGVCNYILNRKGLIILKKDKPYINKIKLNESYSDKIQELNQKKVDGRPLRYDEEILNTVSMMIIIEVLFNEDEMMNKILEGCKKIDKLKIARNNSILAHGYEGVSQEIILDKIESEEVEDILNDIMNKLKDAYEIKLLDDGFYDEENEYKNVIMDLIDKL